MAYDAVPAGLTAAQERALRGPEHIIVFPATDPLIACATKAFKALPMPGGANVSVLDSDAANVLGDHFFYHGVPSTAL